MVDVKAIRFSGQEGDRHGRWRFVFWLWGPKSKLCLLFAFLSHFTKKMQVWKTILGPGGLDLNEPLVPDLPSVSWTRKKSYSTSLTRNADGSNVVSSNSHDSSHTCLPKRKEATSGTLLTKWSANDKNNNHTPSERRELFNSTSSLVISWPFSAWNNACPSLSFSAAIMSPCHLQQP